MSAIEIVRTMIDYHYAYHRRVWDSIMTLTDEQFKADILYSRGSLHSQMLHLAETDHRWLLGLKEKPDVRAFQYDRAAYPTRESVRAACDSAAEAVTAYVSELDEADLTRQPRDLPLNVWQTLLHIVNHGTDHRAQVLRALHELGAPTFDQDAAYYFMQNQP